MTTLILLKKEVKIVELFHSVLYLERSERNGYKYDENQLGKSERDKFIIHS